MIKKGVILVLLFSCLAWGGKKQTLPPLFQKKPLDKIYRSCPRPDSGKFLVKTVDNKGLDDLLSGSFQTIANPVDRFVLGSSTLVYFQEDRIGPDIFPAIVCRLKDFGVAEDILPGKISLWYGRAPVVLSPEKHLWLGPVCRTEWVCRQSRMLENIRLVRQAAVDRKGDCLISFYLTASTKDARDQLKELRFKVEPFVLSTTNWRTWSRRPDGSSGMRPSTTQNSSFWRTWFRLPNGVIKRPGLNGTGFECSSGPKDLIIGVKWIDHVFSNQADVSPAELDFEQQLSKSHPITGLAASARKWIIKTFPAWDSPEPWLNKLWAAQAYTLYSKTIVDESSGLVRLSPGSSLIADARWLRDPRIALGTILTGLDHPPTERIVEAAILAPEGFLFLRNSPDPELKSLLYRHAQIMTACLPKQKYVQKPLSEELLANYGVLAEGSDTETKQKYYREKTIEVYGQRAGKRTGENDAVSTLEWLTGNNLSVGNYDDFITWCRSFYVHGDFARVVNFSLGPGARTMIDRLPRGVLNAVVTGVVGLQADGSDRLEIKPASWIGHWPYFAIDNLPYRGHNLTVAWQSPTAARRYLDMELGLNVFIDGKLVKHAQRLEPVEVELK